MHFNQKTLPEDSVFPKFTNLTLKRYLNRPLNIKQQTAQYKCHVISG